MPTTYTLISSTVLGSSQTSVNISSIPSTYTDIVLQCMIRTDRGSAIDTDNIKATFNNDTTSLYSFGGIGGSGTSAFGNGSANQVRTIIGGATASGSTANTFASAEIYIPNYTSTVNKQIGSVIMQENNLSAAYMQLDGNLYRNTSAISSIQLSPVVGPNIIAGSSFYLYGIKNS